MHRLAKFLLPAAAAVVAMQLVRYPRTNPAVESDLVAPPEVKNVLHHACYDCHSNETAWPWYTAIAPASWIIHHDVEEGRRRLNLSSWADYAEDPGTRAQKLDEISKAVASTDMPPWYYRMLHPDAALSGDQRELVTRWVTQEIGSEPASP
jgi:hypothetical protein